jgi:putative glycosyltransferase (TIGR04372 family)
MIKFLFYLISPFLFFLIVVLSPFIHIRLYLLSSERIGELVFLVEDYLNYKNLKKDKKYLDIFILTHIVSNKTYVELIKRKILVFKGKKLFPVFKLIKLISKRINYFKKFILDHKDFHNNEKYNSKNIQIFMPNEMIIKGDNFLKNIGIKKNDKIICLLVRNDKYLNKNLPLTNYDYHSYRNANIENFIEGINLATKKGYFVFRMGAVKEDLLNINNERFIEYSSLYRSDFLDVYLANRCEFSISTGTGWDALTSLTFRKKHIYVNAVPLIVPITNKSDPLFSIKLHFDNNKKKFLTLKEIFNLNLNEKITNSASYYKKNITLVENSSEDIQSIILEMISKIENDTKNSIEDELLKGKFINICKKYLKDEAFNYEMMNSNISLSFLKKNNYLLND